MLHLLSLLSSVVFTVLISLDAAPVSTDTQAMVCYLAAGNVEQKLCRQKGSTRVLFSKVVTDYVIG